MDCIRSSTIWMLNICQSITPELDQKLATQVSCLHHSQAKQQANTYWSMSQGVNPSCSHSQYRQKPDVCQFKCGIFVQAYMILPTDSLHMSALNFIGSFQQMEMSEFSKAAKSIGLVLVHSKFFSAFSSTSVINSIAEKLNLCLT